MEWTFPEFSRGIVDAAGRILASETAAPTELERAYSVLGNWRAAHAFPQNTFQVQLRRRARDFDSDALIAQRLKRVPSILYKLQRFPAMRLSQMQDIGGCRAVLGNVNNAKALAKSYLNARFEHELVNHKDYIQDPKDSGYRSIHLIYRYNSSRSPGFAGLQVELQLRSRIQHAWATAVETVGVLIQHALKASDGPDRWLRFFSLTSSAFAEQERCPPVPGCPHGPELRDQVETLSAELSVKKKLSTYRQALRLLEGRPMRSARYFLMELVPLDETLRITGFTTLQLEEATDAYLRRERLAAQAGAEVVLVRSDSIDSLRRAYPNYFLDTEIFLQQLERIRKRKTA